MDARAQYVEIAIQQAMRRGDFDQLPGTGKPIHGLTEVNDPDWWIRRKIEREKLTAALNRRERRARRRDR